MRYPAMRLVSCSVALVVGGASIAQLCDLDSPASDASYTESGFNNATTVDPNGGWNVTPNAFAELGAHSPGEVVRFKGQVGTFIPTGGTTSTSRDLDWLRMTLDAPSYINVTVSMGRAGVPFAGAPDQSYVSIYSGSVQATTKSLSFGYDTDGCPHSPFVRLPNGTQKSRIPVPAGDLVILLTTPFNPTSAPTQYDGPIDYAIDIVISPLDNASCGTASNDCVTESASGGCSDSTCCDVVCGFAPSCCSTAWDANCVDQGIVECGNFLFRCVDPVAENDCLTGAALVDLSSGSITFGFDNTDANTDGPNNVNTLCSSNTARDVWYVAGPAPTDGDLKLTMCGQGNGGDSVLSLFNLGASATVDVPAELPSKYVACRDDSCDDDADGAIDQGGPSAITLVGVTQGNYYLIRLGTYLSSGADPSTAPALTPGQLTVSFRSSLYDNGRQKRVKKTADNTLTNLFQSMGYATSTNTGYTIAQPFTMTKAGSIDGFEFVGYNYSNGSLPAGAQVADTLRYAIYSRSSNWLAAFSAANGETLVTEGTVTFNPSSYSNINSDYGRRYFIDLTAPINLFAGDYYWVLKPEKAGATNGAFGIFYYGADAIPQQSPTSFRPAYWAALTWPNSQTFGRYAASATPTYVVQDGDNPDKFYKPALRLKGVVSACFGDIDGSGEVDNGDVAFALLDFGACPGCASDLDGTGEVDFGDVALILLSTGPCS